MSHGEHLSAWTDCKEKHVGIECFHKSQATFHNILFEGKDRIV